MKPHAPVFQNIIYKMYLSYYQGMKPPASFFQNIIYKMYLSYSQSMKLLLLRSKA